MILLQKVRKPPHDRFLAGQTPTQVLKTVEGERLVKQILGSFVYGSLEHTYSPGRKAARWGLLL